MTSGFSIYCELSSDLFHPILRGDLLHIPRSHRHCRHSWGFLGGFHFLLLAERQRVGPAMGKGDSKAGLSDPPRRSFLREGRTFPPVPPTRGSPWRPFRPQANPVIESPVGWDARLRALGSAIP
jgi:hypothetical protein